MLRPLTTRVPAFGLLAEREGDSNFEALRLQKRLRFLTEVPIRIRQVRHINGSRLPRKSPSQITQDTDSCICGFVVVTRRS